MLAATFAFALLQLSNLDGMLLFCLLLKYKPVPDIETPEVDVQEEILDFGNDGKSCVMSLTGNLLSESFRQSFLEAIQGEFLFAKYPRGNHYIHVSSQDPGQLFVIANPVIIVLHPLSQVEEALCDCVKNLMQLSNDLLQDYCFHNRLAYNPALDYTCSMIHMMIGAIKDAKYSHHSDGDPFLNDDGVPDHPYADCQKISSEDMEVFTLIFSNTSAEDSVFLEFFDHKGTLLGKLPMVGNLAQLQ